MQHNDQDPIARGQKQHKEQQVSQINSLLKSLNSQAAVTPRNTAEAKSEGDILQRKSHINPEVFPIKHYRG